MPKEKIDWVNTQWHAGKYKGRSVYHTNTKGLYWCGYMFQDLTPKELFDVCKSTILDLIINHPELTVKEK